MINNINTETQRENTLIRAVASWPVSRSFAMSRRICFIWISLRFLRSFMRGIVSFRSVLLFSTICNQKLLNIKIDQNQKPMEKSFLIQEKSIFESVSHVRLNIIHPYNKTELQFQYYNNIQEHFSSNQEKSEKSSC